MSDSNHYPNMNEVILKIVNYDFESESDNENNVIMEPVRRQGIIQNRAESIFLNALKIVIKASKQGGSGALACENLLLSLYNSKVFPMPINQLGNLDTENFRAALIVLIYDTRVHSQEIHSYLPEHSEYLDNLANSRFEKQGLAS